MGRGEDRVGEGRIEEGRIHPPSLHPSTSDSFLCSLQNGSNTSHHKTPSYLKILRTTQRRTGSLWFTEVYHRTTVSCSTLHGVALIVWLLPAVFCFQQRINIGRHILNGSQLQDVIHACVWVLNTALFGFCSFQRKLVQEHVWLWTCSTVAQLSRWPGKRFG